MSTTIRLYPTNHYAYTSSSSVANVNNATDLYGDGSSSSGVVATAPLGYATSLGYTFDLSSIPSTAVFTDVVFYTLFQCRGSLADVATNEFNSSTVMLLLNDLGFESYNIDAIQQGNYNQSEAYETYSGSGQIIINKSLKSYVEELVLDGVNMPSISIEYFIDATSSSNAASDLQMYVNTLYVEVTYEDATAPDSDAGGFIFIDGAWCPIN